MLKTRDSDIDIGGPNSVGLLSKDRDDGLQIIDPDTGDNVRVLHDGGAWHRWATSSGAEVVVEGSLEGWARYWNAKGEMRYLLDDGPIVTCVDVSADGQRIAVGSTIGDIQVWDASSGNQVNVLRIPECTINRVNLCADGQRVVARLHNGPLMVWDVADDASDEVSEYGDNFCVSSDGRRVVVARAGKIYIWDQSAGKKRRPGSKLPSSSESQLVRRILR